MKPSHTTVVGTMATMATVGLVSGAMILLNPLDSTPNPDPKITPGTTILGVTRDQTCDSNWTHRSRSVPESLKLQVFRAYGIDPTPSNRAKYEIDHRVPVSLGGQSNLSNLWPQPWDGVWGAHTKDRLEFFVYRQVCSGKMTLAEGWAIFLGDWRSAYSRLLGHPSKVKMGAERDDEGDGEGFPR